MRRRRTSLRPPAPGTVLGGLALMVSLGGVAVAAIPGSDGTIQGCYDTSGGKPPYPMYVVDNPADCGGTGHVLLPFNQTGTTGPAGPGGAQGPAGPGGVQGPAGAQGPAGSDANQPVVYEASSAQRWTFTGSSSATHTFTLPLPAGSYAVTAHANVDGDPNGSASCRLEAADSSGFHNADEGQSNGGFIEEPHLEVLRNLVGGIYDVRYAAGERIIYQDWYWSNSIPLETAATLVSSGGAELTCGSENGSQGPVVVSDARIMAIRVGAVGSYRPDAAAEAVLAAKPPVLPKYKPTTHFHQPPPPPPRIITKRHR